MRYSIFDFNQESCIDLGLNMDDLLLMDYIQKAISNPKMKHNKQDPLCVWLNHNKILEDLPILDISENTLKKHLKKLVDLQLLKRVVVASENNRGSKAYYGITDKFINLQFSGVKNDTCSARPGVKNERSYIGQLKKDNSDISIINNTNKKRALVKKKSLYDKMLDEIYLFTKDVKLQDALESFLKLQLEIYKEQGKTYYSNIFKNRLNKLRDEFDEKDWLKVVKHATEKGWQNFYPIKDYDSKPSRKKRICDEGVTNDKYTDEEWEEIKKWQQEQIAKGEQMVF